MVFNKHFHLGSRPNDHVVMDPRHFLEDALEAKALYECRIGHVSIWNVNLRKGELIQLSVRD